MGEAGQGAQGSSSDGQMLSSQGRSLVPAISSGMPTNYVRSATWSQRFVAISKSLVYNGRVYVPIARIKSLDPSITKEWDGLSTY